MDIYSGDVRIDMTGGEGSILFAAGQPAMDAGLETAAAISLFTDAQWWGNEPGEDIGSDLGALLAGLATDKSRLAAEDAARRALAWLVSTGAAASVAVASEMVDATTFALTVSIREPDKATTQTKRYLIPWQGERAHLEAR